jgi:hypothetical protein
MIPIKKRSDGLIYGIAVSVVQGTARERDPANGSVTMNDVKNHPLEFCSNDRRPVGVAMDALYIVGLNLFRKNAALDVHADDVCFGLRFFDRRPTWVHRPITRRWIHAHGRVVDVGRVQRIAELRHLAEFHGKRHRVKSPDGVDGILKLRITTVNARSGTTFGVWTIRFVGGQVQCRGHRGRNNNTTTSTSRLPVIVAGIRPPAGD